MHGLLCSQIGYPADRPARVLWRSNENTPPPALSADGVTIAWVPLPDCWQSQWWEAFVPAHPAEGVHLVAGDCEEVIEFSTEPLWERTWRDCSFESLERRAKIAKNNKGWLDCGSHWQEANSHACCLLGLLDLLEFATSQISSEELDRVRGQIRVGLELLTWYQDLAAELPNGGPGALIHEVPFHEKVVVPADVSKAAAVFARTARFLNGESEREDCRRRAEAACRWLATAEPSGPIGFCYQAHGIPTDSEVPKDFMTRDLLMELWAVIELAHAEGDELPARARELCQRVLSRQFDAPPADCTYEGQFATFDGWPRPELAWTHFLGKNCIGNDVGATQPHPLIPFLRIIEWWPEDVLVPELRESIHRFAYGYFLPACRANPFNILPVGEFPGQGLIWFAGLWHGMNSSYGYAAALAWEFQRFFNDDSFAPLIDGNLQWIAGLNSGIHPGVEIGCEMSTPETIPDRYLPVSMIYGIGHRYFGGWKTIRGTIGSGFCTGKSFYFDVPPEHAHDAPSSFADEDWITFNGAWLGALARTVRNA